MLGRMVPREHILGRALRRRELLAALAGIGVAGLWQAACGSGDSQSDGSTATTSASGDDAATPDCVLTPESTEGPYYLPGQPTRRDITKGRPGEPLALQVAVVDAGSCKPIESADVELWHADAAGVYSGVDGNDQNFLRGHQRSDARGRARFDTIYPGWYPGRTPHIHLKVHVGGADVHTGQLFFDDRTSASVYSTSDYRAHGEADTTNGADGIYAAAGAGEAIVRVTRRNGGGYDGRITVGVQS